MKKICISLLALLAAVATRAAAYDTLDGKPAIWVAHRGGNVEADENTLKAYQIAAGYGADVIECDPRLTKDGVVISMHDPSLDRTTSGKGKVSELNIAEIKSYRTKSGEQVPTIEEILEFAKSAGISVYLDTKDEKNMDYLDQLAALSARCGMEKNVIVGLWNNAQLKYMSEHHPEMATCISWPWPLNSLKRAKKLGASWVGTLVPLASRRMIQRAHQQDLKLITLEINDPETLRQKISFGIDALQTDNPRLQKELGF